jgi:phenylpropionate dioxygenase-like ring-hydroxylating dioxygenase large terminal subunit
MADMQTLIDKTTETQPGITADGWLTDSWYLACTSKEVKPGGLKHLIMLDQPIVVGRTEAGEVFALRDICPHRLVPLSAGKMKDTKGEPTVECPYHGWRFGTDGVCRHMPSVLEEQPYQASRFRVRRYPSVEKNGLIFIFIAHDPKFEGEPDVPPPDFGDLPDRPKFVIEETFNAHMDDAIVGLMDPAHVAFVHSQWWWRPPSAGLKLKEKPFVPRDRGWAIDRHQPSSNTRAYKAVFGGKVTTEIIFQLPGYRWEIVENESARLLTLTCLTPIYRKQTRITQVTWFFGAPLLNLAIPIFKPAARKFLRQDGDIVDLQNEGMKYQKAMIWIDDIDVQAKWYRTLKKEWAVSRTGNRPFNNPIEPVTLRWRS